MLVPAQAGMPQRRRKRSEEGPRAKKNARARRALSVEAGFIQARNLSSSAFVIRVSPGKAKLKV
jgi:hypothetical protein